MACWPLEDGPVSRKRHTPEEIVTKLRQVDVLVNRRHRAELRDELLDGEIFTPLQEAEVLIAA